jgi:FOG: Ankyrin repeat
LRAGFIAESGLDINITDEQDYTSLTLGAKYGNIPRAKQILGYYSVKVDSKNFYGRTPLAHAATRGHSGIVDLLLQDSGVDVNSKNNYGNTVLVLAAEEGHETVIKRLA